eukprot:scaffold53546_cov18-Tisochrysis_lutea.AAC.1
MGLSGQQIDHKQSEQSLFQVHIVAILIMLKQAKHIRVATVAAFWAWWTMKTSRRSSKLGRNVLTAGCPRCTCFRDSQFTLTITMPKEMA